MVLEAQKNGVLQQNLGLLTVVNHKSNYKRIVEHFQQDLNITDIGIPLPDMSHDDSFPEGATSVAYGKVLIDLFDISMKNEQLKIRSISNTLDFFS